jgi:hypothetical protein
MMIAAVYARRAQKKMAPPTSRNQSCAKWTTRVRPHSA